MNNEPEASIRDVALTISHEDNSPKNYNSINFDIALIKLSAKVIFGNRIQSACLSNSEPGKGDQLTATGWGDSSTLTYIRIPNMNKVECSRRLKNQLVLNYETMLCSGVKGKENSCHGDTGGNCEKFQSSYSSKQCLSNVLAMPKQCQSNA